MNELILSSRELPDRRTFELLPGASDLGLMICSVEGRVVVSKVKEYSIAGEDGKVERGDVIDELGRVTIFFYLFAYTRVDFNTFWRVECGQTEKFVFSIDFM